MMLESTPPFPSPTKTMKMITVILISYDSEASRSQNHENGDSPISEVIRDVLGVSESSHDYYKNKGYNNY